MPRTTRERKKRLLKQAMGNLINADAYMRDVAETYAEPMPDVTAALVSCVEMIDMVHNALIKIEKAI